MGSEVGKGNRRSNGGGKDKHPADAESAAATPAPEAAGTAPAGIKKPKTKKRQSVTYRAPRDHHDEMLGIARWQKYFSASLVVFTGLAVAAGIWQGCEMQRQNYIMIGQMQQTERNLALTRMQLRPSISVTNPQIAQPVVNQPVQMSFEIENTGNSPTTIESLKIRPRYEQLNGIVTAGPNDGFDFRGYHLIKTGVPANRKVPWGPKAVDAELKPDNLGAINRGEKILFFAIDITYQSGFGSLDIYTCLCRYDPQTTTLTVLSSVINKGRDTQ